MDFCPYCEAAKKLLKQNDIPFEERKLSMDDDAAWDTLEAKTGMKTMPQILHGETVIGGYNDLAALGKDKGLAHLK